MPEHRVYKGRKVKNARRIAVNGQPIIRITFTGPKGIRGSQLDVPVVEYEANIERSFIRGPFSV